MKLSSLHGSEKISDSNFATSAKSSCCVGNLGALRLYHSLGFQDAGIRRQFYSHPKEDAMILWLIKDKIKSTVNAKHLQCLPCILLCYWDFKIFYYLVITCFAKTSLMTRFNGSSLLIDCGEGTQITIREKGWSFHDIEMYIPVLKFPLLALLILEK